jgi:hypothetical protein
LLGAEYDLIIKALAERYMSHIASLVRGMEVTVEQIQATDKEAVAVPPPDLLNAYSSGIIRLQLRGSGQKI